MAPQPTCTWTGASRKKYVYDVHGLRLDIPPNEPGNFIYAKMDEQHRWIPVYIGQGNLTQLATVDPDRMACVALKGATHVHIHVNFDKEDRLAEVEDLLAEFPQAYAPQGCNQQVGVEAVPTEGEKYKRRF